MLKSFGCSFITGTDLSDIKKPCDYSYRTWPALLASKFDLEYQCHAGGGHGNLSILDRLSQEICHDPECFFVIQWTYIDRFDYSDPAGHHFNQGANDWATILPTGRSQQSNFYFQHLHSEYRDKLTSLIYMKTALDLLQANQCRFLMTCLDPLVFCDRCHVSNAMIQWQDRVRPHMHFFEDQNFLDWSNHKSFPLGQTGHPIESAHQAAADLMVPVIDAILHRA
jgi:hypothetical protein